MLWQIALLLLGLVLLIKGGDLFVSASIRIAEFTRVPRIVIGSTLVSLATTSPEMVVSVMAGARGESALAVGNAVGSVICNIGLILGVTATLKQIEVTLPTLRTPLIAMFVAGLGLFLMTLDLRLARWQGLGLLMAGAGYFAYDFIQNARIRNREAVKEATQVGEALSGRFAFFHSPLGTAVQFAVGAGVVVTGSRFLVDSATSIARGLGVPSIVIGLTVIAIGTSLPELITAISSSRKSVSDLAIGNILGANIANLSLVVGAASSIREVTLDRVTQLFNFPAMLLTMGMLLWMLRTGHRVSRLEGVALLSVYGAYLATLVIMTVFSPR